MTKLKRIRKWAKWLMIQIFATFFFTCKLQCSNSYRKISMERQEQTSDKDSWDSRLWPRCNKQKWKTKW